MYERDELGAELVQAMRTDGTDPAGRVTMAQFKKALDEGIDAVPDAPDALVRFFAVVDEVPDWVDFELVERGAGVLWRMGRVSTDVLLNLSLIGSYRYGGPADLLALTGALTSSKAMRRLGETETWTHAVAGAGGMRRDGQGFKLTVHVRLIHALMNDRYEHNGRWDTKRWGLPINQTDQASTLGLFNSILLMGTRFLGWRVSAEDAAAFMHLWKYVGWLLGINEDWLFDTEREQNAFNYHVLITQSGQTDAGGDLTLAILEGESRVDRGRLHPLRSWYARARLLGILRFFLGKESMRELRIPVGLPWMVPAVVTKNLAASAVLDRTAGGRRYLERVGARYRQKRINLLFEGARQQIGELPL
ncbi:oxygenase MpaB family protein [Streptomyces sp. NPDC047061]|uniref:oxygenase MpaB family protein n=1 Tax=Streptomyces sp. NPDC047061 TaxID=3154605 RepID=UPI0033D81C46